MSDHKAEAERLLEQSSKSTGDPTVWLIAAQASATLYLAEQQRIANLIAYYALVAEQERSGIVPTAYTLQRLNRASNQIIEGLGL